MRTKVGVVTVSDRASQGVYPDRSGPEAMAFVGERWPEAEILYRLVPDEKEAIQEAVLALLGEGCRLLLLTGGTGPAPRDRTPEAVLPLLDKVFPGFGEAMRLASLRETPTAILSRSLAGSRGEALVLLLPGNPRAVRTCLEAVWEAVPTALRLLGG
ncbi:molybdopterin adenylyltransferase [Thermus thermamylovorans]|uniref:Molybdopterin adenylyltransferase n=1 Tax=Thermus thermamylovorans TaxID=2509362 RepID=A0A4Q9AW08_9DEIN|nr:molybdopterin adenylyltransferase [Thermus thermamylovorans]TBH14857.1 molybdopterin adenylyltransferase [Thermus thermamylovorans]